MKRDRAVLFYSVIGIFIATAVLTLLGVSGVVQIQDRFLNPLFASLILELVGAVVGLFKATDWFGGKVQDDHEDVEGGWWQLVSASGDTNVLAFVHISYSDESGQLTLQGDAFTAEGNPHSRFWSISGALNPSTQDYYYFWEGSRAHSNENFSGIGNIRFESPADGGSPRSAVGWYTTGDLDRMLISDRRKVEYLRATEAENDTMRLRDNLSSRRDLVLALRRRTGLAEVMGSAG